MQSICCPLWVHSMIHIVIRFCCCCCCCFLHWHHRCYYIDHVVIWIIYLYIYIWWLQSSTLVAGNRKKTHTILVAQHSIAVTSVLQKRSERERVRFFIDIGTCVQVQWVCNGLQSDRIAKQWEMYGEQNYPFADGRWGMKCMYSFLTSSKTGAESIQICHLTSVGNPIMDIRRFYGRLISTMGFPILVRRDLYIESGPC